MKTAVSIPDDVFDEADQFASQLGISRSEFYTRALRFYVAAQVSDEVIVRLDAVVDVAVATDLAPLATADLIDVGQWEW